MLISTNQAGNDLRGPRYLKHVLKTYLHSLEIMLTSDNCRKNEDSQIQKSLVKSVFTI